MTNFALMHISGQIKHWIILKLGGCIKFAAPNAPLNFRFFPDCSSIQCFHTLPDRAIVPPTLRSKWTHSLWYSLWLVNSFRCCSLLPWVAELLTYIDGHNAGGIDLRCSKWLCYRPYHTHTHTYTHPTHSQLASQQECTSIDALLDLWNIVRFTAFTHYDMFQVC